ncbi:AraC family transcriptional regulator [Shewanella sp. D64]|nr:MULTISPECIES: AraC family transcriptional regulator [unclassified Shewanella]MEC4728947.1 AraC family transcriptional regulator [Shewanella sp. D64]MEC4738497.1 AraC family transcriptional regulator [Shewanella sp. E94]WBJ93717.1 AraC family transcriptional regulator [Shewanella sp. MTB7]
MKSTDLQSQIKREVAEFTHAKELGGIELLNASYHKQNFSRHSHEGYTVGVIESGAQRFYRTGGNHIAPQNSIILVNADEVHNGCSAAEGGWSYRAMYPLPEQLSQLNKELGLPANSPPYFPEPVVHDKPMADILRMMFHTLDTSENRLLRESVLYSTMIKLMTRHSRSKIEVPQQAAALIQLELVKQFLDDHPSADTSLEELAKLAGLSPFYLIKQFQIKCGLPPHAYQIQSRVRLAKQKIKQGYKLLDVAQECGFHDQSHLNRHFKRTMGVTPGQYAKEFNSKFVQANET